MANVYGFVFSSVSPVTNELDRMVDQHALPLPACDITSPQLGHLTNINGFIFPSASPLTTKLDRMVDQHALLLASSYEKYLWFLFSLLQ